MKRYAFLAGSIFACATAATILGTDSPMGDEILFPHARHKKAEVDCLTCHEPIYDAKTLSGQFLPKEAKCLECHKQKKADGQCNFCHLDVKYAATWTPREPRLNFDHAAHIERVKEDCSQCHTRLDEPRQHGPITAGHAACMKCHNHADNFENAQCATCHKDLAAYASMPSETVTHQGDWLRRHPSVARSAQQTCATCHDQNFCLDCHAKTTAVPIEVKLVDRPDRRFIHREDFLGRHSVEVRADPAQCQRCHSVSFCESCHSRSRVSAANSTVNPHPSGWAIPGTGTAFHGDAARRDILNCASCHDQGAQSICVTCHRSGGPGGNPHPSGFLSRHNLSEAATDGRCAICHR
ncbi:MAG TPA: cytochrome c3 family protein [Myxococcales bacterium]|nr:cytochrome c3 family protein [Myxococcales bacterium]